MWTSSRLVLQGPVRELNKVTYLPVKYFSQTTSKNTVVVERWWQVPLSKEGRPPRLYPRRHQVYRVVEDTKHKPKEKMELILTQTVPKLGGRGDTVIVKKSVGRNKLLAQNLAVYPSPENKDMFAEELRLLHEGKPEDRIQTRTGLLTLNYLKGIQLKVEKRTSIDYEFSKEMVCRQILKKHGVVVPVHALRLPEEPIKDLGDYWCEITINGIDTVRIPMSIVPFEDRSARHRILQKQILEQADDAVDSQKTTKPGVLEAAVLDATPKALTADDPVTARTLVINSPAIEVTEVANDQLAQKAVSSEATEPSASKDTALEAEVTPKAIALEAGITPEATALEARVTPKATALEAGITPEATTLEAGVTPEATSLEAGVTPEATSLEAGVPPEATAQEVGITTEDAALEAGVTPEATVIEAGVTPEATVLEAGVTPEATSLEAGVTPGATAVEAGVTPEATVLEAGVTPEATALEAGVTPEATVLETGVTTEAAALEAGVTTEAAALEAVVTPETAVIEVGVTPGAAALEAGVTSEAAALEAEVTPEATALEAGVTPEATSQETRVTPCVSTLEAEVTQDGTAHPAFEVEVAPEAVAPPAFEVEVAPEVKTPFASEAQTGPGVSTPTSLGVAAPSTEEVVSETAVGPSLALESSGVPPEEKETASKPEAPKEGKTNSVTKGTKDD